MTNPLDEQTKKDGPMASPNRREAAPMDEPVVEELSGKEAVFALLAFTRQPMGVSDISKWLAERGQDPLTEGQVAGGFYSLLNKYDNVVEKVKPGTYRVHSAWNGKPLDEQTRKDGPVALPHIRARRGVPKVGVVIPCYGTYWDRGLVEWRNGDLLGKQELTDAEAVNFADQTGVYVLYQWPRVNYVGRTTTGNLYQRLSTHVNKDDRGPWDKFSWFGLRSVGDDGRLKEPEPYCCRFFASHSR